MKVIGHRGAKNLAPENTIPSMQAALDNGVDAIEFDVHITKDRIAVIVHDESIPQAGNRPAVIAQHTYDELKLIKPDLATFREVMDFIDKRVPVMVEFKPGVPFELIAPEIKRLIEAGWATENIWLASRDLRIIKAIRSTFPDLRLIIIDFWSAVRLSSRARRFKTRHVAIGQRWLWPGVIRSLTRNYTMYSWPINTLEQAKVFQRLGVEYIITDSPDIYKDRSVLADTPAPAQPEKRS
jgi:glycerophosphoryl diester phosphodiesterase